METRGILKAAKTSKTFMDEGEFVREYFACSRYPLGVVSQ